MHWFTELADDCVFSTLNALNDAHEKIVEELRTSAATRLVKGLQMINLQKAILAVGMFSLFEANLQGQLNCTDRYAFDRAATILEAKGHTNLKEKFTDFRNAINVLKHGDGSSYRALVAKAANLPFRIKLPTEALFFEGDVSEVDTLIQVDDAFVRQCAEIVRDVSRAVA